MHISCVSADDFLPACGLALLACVQATPDAVIGVSGGMTTMRVLAALRERALAAGVSLRQVRLVALECGVGIPADSPVSFTTLFRRFFQDGTDVPAQHLLTFDDAGAEAPVLVGRLAATLQQLPLTVALIGVGTNAHVAAIEPAGRLPARSYTSTLTPETVATLPAEMAGHDQVVTAGMADLMLAGKILIVANGARKLASVAALQGGMIDPQLPVTFFLGHRDVRLITDHAAGRPGGG